MIPTKKHRLYTKYSWTNNPHWRIVKLHRNIFYYFRSNDSSVCICTQMRNYIFECYYWFMTITKVLANVHFMWPFKNGCQIKMKMNYKETKERRKKYFLQYTFCRNSIMDCGLIFFLLICIKNTLACTLVCYVVIMYQV